MQTNLLYQSVYENILPWVVLAILIGLFILVGPKASANDVKLKDNVCFKRPMLALEMCADKVSDMFDPWDESTREKLRAALWWDYLFIFIYAAMLATMCFLAARFLDAQKILAFEYGLIVICLQLVAAMSDAIENFALLKVLDGQVNSTWPQMARWCAILKFGLIFVGLLYSVALGGGTWVVALIRKAF
jgi:hypothetical protein